MNFLAKKMFHFEADEKFKFTQMRNYEMDPMA